MEPFLVELHAHLTGEILTDPLTRALYATDASPYQQPPLGVARPRSREDCVNLMRWATTQRIPLIPRGAGTSLAGQCVGTGLVVDIARHMNQILAIDPINKKARVQPGVVLADLNDALRHHGLWFPPDPSTATRCTLAGMVGNNAWGVHAVRDGTTRDWVEAMDVILSDGSEARFGPLTEAKRQEKLKLDSLEGAIHRKLDQLIGEHRARILERYPSSRGVPNNMGYALDVLARQQPWDPDGPPFNLAPFLCGSEGTLTLVTEITLRLAPLPARRLLLCAHFHTLAEAIRGVEVAMKATPAALELLDRNILELTRNNAEQARHRFWIEGGPDAVLLIELRGESEARELIDHFRSRRLGYAFPVLASPELDQVWELRRAGLGLLMGLPGKQKAVTGIEDTAVALRDLPAYVDAMLALMRSHGVPCVVYGPVSMGGLHLRPLLDIASPQGLATFETLLTETANVVKRFGGSLSAKHGDGRLRAPYLASILGSDMVALLREIKATFDPAHVLNPGKVLDPPPVTADLRPHPSHREEDRLRTQLDWEASGGLFRAADKCHGSGVCLKRAGRGVMCPSYMATREELHGTRGRANLFRQVLASPDPRTGFATEELRQALDLCLACKGCRAECPANVDMARLKAEFLQADHDFHGTPWRARLLGRFVELNRMANLAPPLANSLLNADWFKRMFGFHGSRPFPRLAAERLSHWFCRRTPHPNAGRLGQVVLLNDPFTEFYEPEVGQAAVEALEHLGYGVQLTRCVSLGRAAISQGDLRRARATIERALNELHPLADQGLPILWLEPSEGLTLRDEAVDLVRGDTLREQVRTVARQLFSFEEWMIREARAGRIAEQAFDIEPRRVLLHVHCHQKSFIGAQASLDALRLLTNTEVTLIPSGCCGMAGAFGYEAEHFDLSQTIGELVLFPAIRAAPPDTLIVATGTSCRQQIRFGTGREPLHPAQIFRAALRAPLKIRSRHEGKAKTGEKAQFTRQ
jgi:FAD/FMN-containing dehydrogenase/Fe-S oxidoreductase